LNRERESYLRLTGAHQIFVKNGNLSRSGVRLSTILASPHSRQLEDDVSSAGV